MPHIIVAVAAEREEVAGIKFFFRPHMKRQDVVRLKLA
jgi:hypothetical protein